MSKKRDLVSEIIERQSRCLKDTRRFDQFSKRASPLLNAYKYVEDIKDSLIRDELFKYFPVAITACVESYFKLVIKETIDSHDDIHENVSKLVDRKFDITPIISIAKKKITLGDFVSHLISINRLKDIDNIMSNLLGLDIKFLDMMRKITFDFDFEENCREYSKIADRAYSNIEETFRLRHVFAHEIATLEKVPVKKLLQMMSDVIRFVFLTEMVLEEVLADK